jgi:hypothetical protein
VPLFGNDYEQKSHITPRTSGVALGRSVCSALLCAPNLDGYNFICTRSFLTLANFILNLLTVIKRRILATALYLVNKNCIPLSNSPFRSGNKVLAQGHITPRISGAALLRPTACACYAARFDHETVFLELLSANS